ncbi:VOC family protein [Phyllobacterium meliloti]|uniref:VOC family protein n=1 Tax=Phyllobacterium meliloti TaxID=555317 RepID=UPI001D15DA58|nr:VOC family protein [Phyllobacterium sp. T1293]UGX85474.1 VOC family protein [Phyllobacterium sp. T1293]
MSRHIGMITLVVRDYDEAIEWYTGVLGFSLVSNTALSPTKRWVVVAPEKDGAKLLLAQADTETQISSVGNQTGGRVALFLYTDDFTRDHAAMLKSGVRFLEDPRHEAYGSVAVFEDLYGNTWDLLELK